MKYLADENLLKDQQGGFRNTYDVLNDLAKNYDLVRGGVGNAIDWQIEYKTVWVDKENIVDWKPKAAVYARGGMAEVVFADEGKKPVEKRGLYDLYIDNHIDIPEGISKDSPCYKQFMKERGMVE